MDWSSFHEVRVLQIRKVHPFGARACIVDAEAQVAGVHQINVQYVKKVAEGFYHYLNEWQQSNTSLSAMLKLPQKQYSQKWDSLLRYVGDQMPRFIAFAQENGCFDILTGND